ncbi:MAG: DNA-binding beta-propeller fold protein YncE [Paracoccaceae bacterium]|jgi:DNA-binding beta-propeller fold protein YncE
MKTLLKIWLLVVVVYILGASSMMFSIWPAPDLVNAYLYAFDNRLETKNMRERVWSDLDITPYRLLTHEAGGAPKSSDFVEIDLPQKRDRRLNPHLFVSPDRTPRLTFIHGVFDFTDGLHGAILLDESGAVSHRWRMTEDPADPRSKPDHRLFPHGVLVDPNGDATFIFDFGSTITKIDACGKTLWSHFSAMDYNHVLSRASDGDIWTLAGAPNHFVKIKSETGEEIKSISMGDLLNANPNLGIFTSRASHYVTGRKWMEDPFHGNDIEELSPEMATAFPMFNPSDLLISFRTLNLIFVFDPDTLAVKWWRQGVTQQQHDPDWTADGTITVFDNRWDNPPSRLTAINPATNEVTTVLDGAKYDFFTVNRGKAQRFGDDWLVTSTKQGRVFEVDAMGRVQFEFINTYDDKEGLRALVSEAIALPMDYFKEFPKCD